MAGKGIVPSSRSAATVVSDKVTEPVTTREQPPTKVSGDLPIARRASLHRFFEKRKDRYYNSFEFHKFSQIFSNFLKFLEFPS